MNLSAMTATVAVGTFIVTVPAAADPVRLAQGARLLPTYEIRTIIRSTGLDPIGPARRRGRNFVMRAIDDDGRVVWVVVDGRFGEVVSVAPVLAPPPVRPGPRIATVPPDVDGPRIIYDRPDFDDEDPSAGPPHVVTRLPSAQVAPSRHPPLPRPRPAEASLASVTGSISATEPATKNAPEAKSVPAAKNAPATEPKKQQVKVPPVAPLDPHNHAQIPD